MSEMAQATGRVGGMSRARRALWRLRKARVVRLLGGLAVLGMLVGVLAFGVQRLLGPAQKFTAIALPYVEEFTDLDPRRWFNGGGVWALRTETLAQNANLNKPAALYLPGKIAPEQPYHLSTYVTFAKPTQQAGINFNAQYPDMPKRQHQVYLARRSADGTGQDAGGEDAYPMELVAGYTDKDGNFVKQVDVPFGPDTGEYRLDLYVLGNTYTVQVNGQNLIERRPLFYPNGLVGFHTLGPARFDTLKITMASTEDPGEQVYVSDFAAAPGGAGWVPFSGEWEIADGELVQANPAAQAAGIGYEGSAFEEYGVQVTLRHLTGAGGGLLFNMVSPYVLDGAHVVRFSDQSDAVFWGYYDPGGVFTRQGYASVAAPGMDVQQLRVLVGAGSYDVYLNNQLLARAVPIHAPPGPVGAVDARGPTTTAGAGSSQSRESAAVAANNGDMAAGRSGGHIGLITALSSVAYSLVEVFPLLQDATAAGPVQVEGTGGNAAGQPGVVAASAVLTPTAVPTAASTATATAAPTNTPTMVPTMVPTMAPTMAPTLAPSATPTASTTAVPTKLAAAAPSDLENDTAMGAGALAGPQIVTPTATATATAAPTTATPQSRPTPGAVVPGREAEWRSEFRGTLAAAGWRPIAGQWRFANDSLLQEDPTGFDSAVVYRASAFADYSYRATFRQRDGNGAGLLFNLPDPDSLAGGHMVRYSDRRPGGIFWGYYEADGKFVGQGYANVAPPGDVSHTLRVVSGPETYAIYLDDFLLATDVPLRSKSGYVGLVTVQTAAEFDSAAVGAPDGTMVGTGAAGGSGDETGTASGALAGAAGAGTLGTDIPAEAAATVAGTGEAGTGQAPLGALPRAAPGIYRGELGFPSQTTVSGKWMVEDGVFRQTAPDPADYILNTGIAAADYTLAADVLLANKPEVGGGFLLQAPERGRKAGATVVRFTNGGESLFWGVYDEAGTFRGRQAVDLPQKPEGETGYVLRVEVRGNTLDVYVDGEQVIAGAVLPQTQGYLGLLAFGGPVTFANVEITVRQAGAAP